MQTSRIQSKITFTTAQEFREYCASHVMRPDTEWEIASTGERDRGPRGETERQSPSQKSLPNPGALEAISGPGKELEKVGVIEKMAQRNFAAASELSRQADNVIQRWCKTVSVSAYVSRKDLAEHFVQKIDPAVSSMTQDEDHNREILLSSFGREKSVVFGEGEIRFSKAPQSVQSKRIQALEFLGRLGNSKAIANTRIAFEQCSKGNSGYSDLLEGELLGDLDTGKVFSTPRYADFDGKPTNQLHGRIAVSPDSEIGVYIHEIGHAIENANPEIQAVMRDFFNVRTSSDSEVDLMQFLKKNGADHCYGKGIKIKPDNFYDSYAGRIYAWQYDSIHRRIVKEVPGEVFRAA